MRDRIFADLNPKQREAVEILSGPLLILAGAGSGKTKALTHRIANLIANGVPGSEILAVTFTNKAANEMKTRIEKLLESGGGDFFASNVPLVGTFHSICVRILRSEIENLPAGISRNFVIFDTDDSQRLMKLLIKESPYDEKEIKYKAVLSHISAAKNQLMSPNEYVDTVDHNRFTEAVAFLFPKYQKKLQEHNAMDFDDLLQKTVQVFESVPESLARQKKRWSHLLVDEYQDTNFAQYRFVRLLSDDHQNLCVIGDDHQSIYSFRGADYTNILNFEKDFPAACIIKLEQNYRSTANILNNANSLIGHNETGHPKNLWTKNEEGEKLVIREVADERDEGNFIAERITELVRSGAAQYTDCAILYRMNAQSRAIEEAFMRARIPYQIVGGTRFFDRMEIKDVIAYLRLIFNAKDDISFLRIINTPKRHLGGATLDALKDFASQNQLSLFESLRILADEPTLSDTKKETLLRFHSIVQKYQARAEDTPVSTLLEGIIEDIKYLEHLDDGTAEGEARQQNVKELFSVASRYDTAESPLTAFLEGVALIADIDNLDDSADRVTLMTIHASKGLEFPIVFLPGWEDGIFPSSSSQSSPDTLEEERRLGYVAITRAQKRCTITYARQRMLFGRTEYASPSKFLSELDEECTERVGGIADRIETTFSPRQHVSPRTRTEALFGLAENRTDYQISDRIHHAEFGEGTIVQISGDVLTVAFAGRGVKKIVASVAPIEKI